MSKNGFKLYSETFLDKNFLVSIEGDVNKVKKEQDDFARPRGFES